MKQPSLFKRFKYFLEIRKLTKDTTMFDKLKSRKLWATIVGGILVTLGDAIGLSPDAAQWIVTLVTGYIVGQGIADAGAGIKLK